MKTCRLKRQLLIFLYDGLFKSLKGIDNHLTLNGRLGLIDRTSSARRSLCRREPREQRQNPEDEARVPAQLRFQTNANGTIPRQINSVETSDDIQSVWDGSRKARRLHAKANYAHTHAQGGQKKLNDNELAGDVTHQKRYGATSAVTLTTCHPHISLRVKGSQVYSTPIR